MNKPTKEEISLCKQIAEKYRKEIKYGDWYYSKYLKEVLLQSPFINVVRDREIINRDKNVIPLWTISDCLEFLGGSPKIQMVELLCEFGNAKPIVIINWKEIHKGNTPLEACLKPTLAVVEETK